MGNRSGKHSRHSKNRNLTQSQYSNFQTKSSPQVTPIETTPDTFEEKEERNIPSNNHSIISTNFENENRNVKPKSSIPTRSRTMTDLPSASWEILYEDIDFSETRSLGRGGFGCVQLGVWRGTNVAVKTLFEPIDLVGGDFLHELNMLCRLQHPNIVQLLGFCTSPSRQCLVTEYLQGGSLSENLSRLKSNSQQLELPLYLKIAADISKGMYCLHTEKPPIIHRDLKSANILVNSLSIDVNVAVKVADFGISKEHTPSVEHTRYQGTFLYMAPEVFGSQSYTTKIDIFSFGIILWEMITLERPWSDVKQQYQIEERIVQGVRPQIPSHTNPAISQLIAECWSHEPHLRPGFDLILRRIKELGVSLGIGDPTTTQGLSSRNPQVSSDQRKQLSRSTGNPSSQSRQDPNQLNRSDAMSRSVDPNKLNQKRQQRLTFSSTPNSYNQFQNSPGSTNHSGNSSLPNTMNSNLSPPVKIGPHESTIITSIFSLSDTAPWDLFRDELVKILNARPDHVNKVKTMLTETGTDIVSRKQFYEFLLWFSPLKKDESIYEGIEEDLNSDGICFAQIDELFCEPWFHGYIDSVIASQRLKQNTDGCFLVRFSQSEPGNYAISINDRGRIRHWKILVKDSKYVINSKNFSSLEEIVNNYRTENLESRNGTVHLLVPCPKQ